MPCQYYYDDYNYHLFRHLYIQNNSQDTIYLCYEYPYYKEVKQRPYDARILNRCDTIPAQQRIPPPYPITYHINLGHYVPLQVGNIRVKDKKNNILYSDDDYISPFKWNSTNFINAYQFADGVGAEGCYVYFYTACEDWTKQYWKLTLNPLARRQYLKQWETYHRQHLLDCNSTINYTFTWPRK